MALVSDEGDGSEMADQGRIGGLGLPQIARDQGASWWRVMPQAMALSQAPHIL
jgi:hypothetical protein